MAINSQKFLPSIKSSSFVNKNQKDSSSTIKTELLLIKHKLIKINFIVNKTFSLQKENDKNIKKQTENKKFLEKEKRLEDKKHQKESKIKDNIIPQIGIMDRINRFITFTLIGFLVNKFFKYLPDIIEFTKKIEPVVNFIESFVGNIFKGFVDFIDFGYKTYDKVRDFTKTIGGENFQKTFDDFNKNLNTFVNLAIIAGMATMGGTDFGLGKKGDKPGKLGTFQYKPTAAEKTKNQRIRNIQRKYGPNARKIYENALNNGKTPTQAEAAVKKGFKKGVSIRPGADSLASKTAPRGSILSRGLGRAPGRLATRVLGKGAMKVAGKVFGRIPIIGGLVNFLFALWSGEPVGRAAAKGVGATIGSALGTFIPIPFAGTILGGILGDIVGGALYDTLVQTKPKKPQVQAKKSGGPITTRGGRQVGGAIKRTLRRNITPPKVTKVIPGSDVGGKKSIQKIFPEPTGNNVGKTVNPFGFLTDTTNSMGEVPFLGPLFSMFGKILLGQFPNKTDYRTIGLGINAWINNAISKGYLQGNLVKGFADGGIIDNDMMRDFSGWVEKSVEELVKNKVTEAINDLRRNLGMEPLSSSESESSSGDLGEGLGVYVSSDSPDFWLLATAALFEGITPQGYADVAQAIYNRVAMPGDPWHVNNSISKAILNPGQFQPVTDYGGAGIWSRIKTKEDAIRFVESKGRTKAQLETAAAAILDKNKQASARQFVGPRDNFRSYKYEDENNHLADDTEVRRDGHVFGFEPRGATIGSFRAGKLTAAQVSDTIQGTVSAGDGKFIQGNSGDSGGIHFHIGPGNQPGQVDTRYNDSARAVAFKVVKYFLGKKPLYHGRSQVHYSGNENDATIRKMIEKEQIVHTQYGSDGGVDIQVGGRYWPGAKVAFPFAVSNMAYRTDGFGVSAKIDGFNAFVAHGAYDQNGKKAKQYRFSAYKEGGIVSPDKKTKNIKSIQSQASYDDKNLDFVILVQPLELEKIKYIQNHSDSSINFGFSGSVNNNDKLATLFGR